MRLLLTLAVLLLTVVPLIAETTTPKRPAFANFKVSSRTVALNQPVRIEFTTLPRQIEGIDIARTVAQALDASRLAGFWRPLGTPTVTEHEKTHTITVSFSVLARKVGELPLPRVPLAWIADNQIVEFGQVTVTPNLLIGGDTADLPGEISGIAGHLWGERVEAARERLGTEALERRDQVIVANPVAGLELFYREGALGEAVLTVADLPLPRARDSFLSRWGVPQIEEAGSLTWILGWTRITATAGSDGTGTRLHFTREDIQAILDRARVSRDVFGVLDGREETVSEADAQQQRQRDAERELRRVTGEE